VEDRDMTAHGSAPHPLAHVVRRLRPLLDARDVLLVGAAAEQEVLMSLVRLAGARVMAASDVDAAILLLLRFPADVVIAEADACTADGTRLDDLISRHEGRSTPPLFVELGRITGCSLSE
jgi:hypothetical protein